MSRGRRRTLVVAILIVSAVVYLRDPAWLVNISAGFGRWQTDRGVRFRWMNQNASFFVPSGASAVAVPVRALFETDDHSPFIIRFALDGRPATQVVLSDEAWAIAVVKIIPRRSSWPRRHVRVDLHVNRTWGDSFYGVQVGETSVSTSPR